MRQNFLCWLPTKLVRKMAGKVTNCSDKSPSKSVFFCSCTPHPPSHFTHLHQCPPSSTSLLLYRHETTSPFLSQLSVHAPCAPFSHPPFSCTHAHTPLLFLPSLSLGTLHHPPAYTPGHPTLLTLTPSACHFMIHVF